MLLRQSGSRDHSLALSAEAATLSKQRPQLHLAAFLAQLAELIDPENAQAIIAHARCMAEGGFPNAALRKVQTMLQREPDNWTALALSGQYQLHLSKHALAEVALRRALQGDGAQQDWADCWAKALRQTQGDAALRDALSAHLVGHPDHWRLHIALGQCLERLGDLSGAREHHAIAARLAPDEADTQLALADLAFRQSDAVRALDAKTRAVELDPRRAISVAPHQDPSRPRWTDDSVSRMRHALEAARPYVADQLRLSAVAARLDILSGDDAAIEAALSALTLEDGGLELGLFAIAQGHEPSASLTAKDMASFLWPLLSQGLDTRVLDIDLRFRACRTLMRRILIDGGSRLEALARWIGSVEDGGAPKNWALANLAYRSGQYDRARAHYRTWALSVSEAKPGSLTASHVSMCRLVDDLGPDGELDLLWDMFLERDETLLAIIRNAYPFVGLYPTKGEAAAAALVRQAHRLPSLTEGRVDGPAIWSDALMAAAFLAADDRHYDRLCNLAVEYFRGRAPSPVPHVPASPRSDRIRVGYVMTDFQHQDLPPEQYALKSHDLSRFDPIVYYLTPEATCHVRPDRPCPPTLADWGGRLRSIDRMPSQEAADLIRQDGLDLLVDVVGWWAWEIPELFMRRPAPVQVTWLGLGHPGKTGVMDYLVGSEQLLPRDMDGRYPEAFVRLSPTYIPPKPVPEGIPPTPRALLGLPEDAFVYLGYHQVMKVTERTLSMWFEILRRTPGSYLILPQVAMGAVEPFAEAAGVSPDRIRSFRWVGSELEHISRIGAADLYLDTYPFNAAALTGYDALAVNVPRITLSGPNIYSRFGNVLLHSLGLDDLVCSSEAEYIDLAVDLHDDPRRLQDVRRRMEQARRSSPATAPAPVMKGLEAAWDQIVSLYRAGQPPTSFDVEAREL